jgi:hypothetical protein
MNDKSTWLTLSLFAAVTLLSFAVGMILMLGLWGVMRLSGVEADFWAMTEAIATAFAAAAVIGAGVIAYRELNEVSSSRHMEVADRLFDELNSPENIAARRWVYQNLPPDPAEGLSKLEPDGQEKVKAVLNSLDRVAFLTQSNWIPDEIIMPWMHPMIEKSWDKLEPYVLYERDRRKEPYYYERAGELAERCKKWRKVNLPDLEVEWVDKAL